MGKQRRSFTPEVKQEAVDLCRRSGKSACQVARERGELHSGCTGGWSGADGSILFGRGRRVPFWRSSFSKTSCLSFVGSSILFSRCSVPNSAALRAFNSAMSASSLTRVGVRNTSRLSFSVARLWNLNSQPRYGISPKSGIFRSLMTRLSRTSPPTTIVC